MRTTRTAIPLLVFTIVFLVLCFIYYPDQLFMYPQGIHEWAQSDRLALALKFYDNGMNFFKPSTFHLASTGGVTGVEFPIQAYLAALFGQVFGRDSISTCFRLITLAMTYGGLAALFLLAYRHTKDTIVSLVVPVFFFCSPVFIFYSCNYLPDTAAVSLCFIGFYFFDRFIDQGVFRDLVKTIAILTLATLIKTSTGTFLIGIMGITILWPSVRQRTGNPGRVVLLFACSLAAIIGYYFYNRYLNATYHSDLFLAQAKPFEDGEFDLYLNKHFKEFWIREYFVLPQYLLLAGIPVAGIPLLSKNARGKTVLATMGIFFVGVIAMALLFGHQFIAHDYYVMPVFFPLFAYAMVMSVVAIRQHIEDKAAIRSLRGFAVVSMLLLFVFADYHNYRRVHLNDERFYRGFKNPMMSTWLKGGDKVLDSLGIGRKEPVIVVGEMAPNLPFVYLDRNGYLLDPHPLDSLTEFADSRHVRAAIGEAEKMGEFLQRDSTVFNDFTIVTHERIWILLRKN